MTTDLKASVNSLEYLNEIYEGDWIAGYQDAYKRLDKEIEVLGKYGKHLDIGCADGYFTKKYLEKYPDTIGWGIDLSNVVINNKKKIYEKNSFWFTIGTSLGFLGTLILITSIN